MPTFTANGKSVEVDGEGFLLRPGDWSEDMAPDLATSVGIEHLTDRHWIVIRFLRDEYKANGEVPSLRRIKNNSGVGMKELYELFPNRYPAKKRRSSPAWANRMVACEESIMYKV